MGIDMQKLQVTFVAHRGFAPDGSTIYYIATDASVKEAADALGVAFVEKTGATIATPAASDLYMFANGIKGTGLRGSRRASPPQTSATPDTAQCGGYLRRNRATPRTPSS